ncbi:MAG TPA: DUF2892 domain-containing protein [Stellaceae bacterium]|jgi:hypothetical protein|nr:DUF2892 domain-containing protein [Stellaceae bacterium]
MADIAAPAQWRNINDRERLASGIGGALLLGYGLARRPSAWSALLTAGGVLLLERSLSGHCSLYRALGIDTSGDRARRRDPAHPSILDAIERASDHSFPASDPPSWGPSIAGSPAAAH